MSDGQEIENAVIKLNIIRLKPPMTCQKILLYYHTTLIVCGGRLRTKLTLSPGVWELSTFVKRVDGKRTRTISHRRVR